MLVLSLGRSTYNRTQWEVEEGGCHHCSVHMTYSDGFVAQMARLKIVGRAADTVPFYAMIIYLLNVIT